MQRVLWLNTKRKNNKLDFKIKNFSKKEPIKRIKRQVTEWVKVFDNRIFSKGQIFRIYFKIVKTQTNKKYN